MKVVPPSAELLQYILDHSQPLHPALADLRAVTAERPDAGQQISPDQAPVLHFMARLIGAQRILEIGCLTGYGAIAMALALPAGGRLVTLDRDPEVTAIARAYFQRTGVADRIELRLGLARDSLAALELEGARFDMAFIDADKEPLADYVDRCQRLVRPGGLIVIDNALWGGRVLDPADTTPGTAAIRATNAQLAGDPRFERLLLNVGDGMLFLLRH